MERSYLVFIPVFAVLIAAIFAIDYAPYIISSHMPVDKDNEQEAKFNEIAYKLIYACMNTRSDYVIENCDTSMS